MILLIKFTSRQRPKIMLDTLKLYYDLASDKNKIKFLITLDSDDATCNTQEHIDAILNILKNVESRIVFGTSTCKIDAINRDLNEYKSEWDIVLNASDDQQPIVYGYDEIIRKFMPNDLDASLWFSDGSSQDSINTQEIVGRKYYQRFDYIYHPDFKSFFCDNLSTEIANILCKQIKSEICIIKHKHPHWYKDESVEFDELYQRNDKYWKEDQETYNRLKPIINTEN